MQPTLIMMVGLPGSGKTTKAHELSRIWVCPTISSDEIRKEITGSEDNQECNEEVFKVLHQRVKDELLYNKSQAVIYDACNISYKKRAENGGRFVPEYAIERMYKNIYIPQYYEGWDEIIIDTQSKVHEQYELTNLFYGENGLFSIKHDNPHHTLSIGNHCLACYLNTLEFGNKADINLHMAALLHDIGKKFTKEYKDSKGNPTDAAHYYQHHLVSAYDAIKYLNNFSTNNMLEILALIQWHMFPYFWEKDDNKKMEKKYRNLWGEELYRKIMLLHKADEAAH